MTLANVKADNNVPQTPGLGRSVVVTDRSSTWVIHKTRAGRGFDGNPPQAQDDDSDIDTIRPTIRAGFAMWDNLAHAGLFTLLAHYGRSIIVEEVSNPGGATLSTVDSTGAPLRTALPAVPFKLAPGECLKAVGATQNTSVGFLVRFAEQLIL